MKPSFYFNKKLERIAEELIFDNEDTWKFMEEHNLGVPDTECGVVEEIWDLVMDALVRGYYLGKEKKPISEERKKYTQDLIKQSAKLPKVFDLDKHCNISDCNEKLKLNKSGIWYCPKHDPELGQK
jgi:hypothetical protein